MKKSFLLSLDKWQFPLRNTQHQFIGYSGFYVWEKTTPKKRGVVAPWQGSKWEMQSIEEVVLFLFSPRLHPPPVDTPERNLSTMSSGKGFYNHPFHCQQNNMKDRKGISGTSSSFQLEKAPLVNVSRLTGTCASKRMWLTWNVIFHKEFNRAIYHHWPYERRTKHP